MSDHTISRFPVPELDSLPEDIKERVLAVQEKAGFVPNVFVDVGDFFDRKLDAVALYRKVIDRGYLDDDYLVHRARWWGQVSGHPGRLCEAYELLLWR